MLGAAWVGVLPLVRVPAVVPADAPAAVFSGARAMQDLAVVAAQPHPIGSPANGVVRDYLLAEIARLGLQGQVQRTTVNEISPLAGIAQVTPVENVLVRLPGTRGGGKAVLISGHYDSVATTPGAGDCGSCSAAVLETLRAAAAARDAGQGLQNDVIFLFTDGEELGVVGATAFMREHPWAKDVGLSIVLEGLGTQGSSLLYASGPQHGSVVLEALGAMAEPGGYAYLNDVMWKLAGNSGSDLDAFVADGRPGLAFVHLALDGVPAYHSGGDNVQALNPGTLQQHGDQALSLVRHFGNVDLDKIQADPDAIYFLAAARHCGGLRAGTGAAAGSDGGAAGAGGGGLRLAAPRVWAVGAAGGQPGRADRPDCGAGGGDRGLVAAAAAEPQLAHVCGRRALRHDLGDGGPRAAGTGDLGSCCSGAGACA